MRLKYRFIFRLGVFAMNHFSARLAIVALTLSAGHAHAIDIEVDFSLDTSGFFDPNTTDGANARATLYRAATDYSRLFTDVLDPIQSLGSTAYSNGTVDWEVQAYYVDPSTGVVDYVPSYTSDENKYVIYVGGQSLSTGTLAEAGPGGVFVDGTINGTLTQAEYNSAVLEQSNLITQTKQRGEPTGEFSTWGGWVSFDSDTSTTWNYDWQTTTATNEYDLYTTALHEIAHTVGFSSGAIEWTSLVDSNDVFTGTEATAANGGIAPQTVYSTAGAHWDPNLVSTVPGTGASQTTVLEPYVAPGEEKLLTVLDIAGFADIGWEIDPDFSFLYGDTDNDGDVDDSDLGTIFSNYTGPVGAAGGKLIATGDTDGDGDVDDADLANGFANYTGPGNSNAASYAVIPEPSSLALMALGGLMITRRRRR